jgi:hypothetical protein
MFDPLPDSVIAALRSDETAALAAMLIVGGAFPDILAFAARVLDAPEPHKAAAKPRRPSTRSFKSPTGRRRGERERDDERLIAAMKANPNATTGALAEAIGKSRTSTVTALHRLRDAGLAESPDGVWALTEPSAPKETPRWTAPVSAQGGRRRVETEEREHA